MCSTENAINKTITSTVSLEKLVETKLPRKEWRRQVKKLQRQRRRQKSAKERDKQLEAVKAAKLADPSYQYWLKKQEELEEFERQAEEEKRQEEEAVWLRRELLAQQQFRLMEIRREAAQNVSDELRRKQAKLLTEFEQKKEKRRQEKEEAVKQFEDAMQRMELYLDNPEMPIPNELLRFVETKPSQNICAFFERTNSCRFGLPCLYNHKRPLLSRIIIIRNFFSHPLMEQATQNEYDGAESLLELNEYDLQQEYETFYYDVVPELESFGKILNFRTTRNLLPHLRGHVFVEYTEERMALKAFIRLQGRYYAAKQLNVEFSNILSWRRAVCGFSLTRKCPKGHFCHYLHLFRNPGNKYNESVGYETPKPATASLATKTFTPLLSWNDVAVANKKLNWRWSETPEMELKKGKADSQTEKDSETASVVTDMKESGKSRANSNEREHTSRHKKRERTKHRTHSKSPKRKHTRDSKHSKSNERLSTDTQTPTRTTTKSNRQTEKRRQCGSCHSPHKSNACKLTINDGFTSKKRKENRSKSRSPAKTNDRESTV